MAKPGTSRGKPNRALLEARIRKGLSSDALGRAAGVSGKQVRSIEAGRVRWPHADTKESIASVLDADPVRLFPPEREPKRPKRSMVAA